MADSQPLEASIAAVTASSPTTVTAATATTISAAAAITTSLIPSDNHTNTVTTTTTNSNTNTNTNTNNFGASLAPKRQRRPSVRLGEIGGDGKARRPRTTWRFYKDPTFAAKASKTRPITNLVTVNDNGNGNGSGGGGGVGDNHFSDINFDFGKGRTKSKKPSKKVKTNWTSLRLDSNGVNNNKNHANSSDNENDNRELREFELEEAEDEGSESPVHSIDNVANEYWQGNPRMVRARVSDNELPELNSQDRKCSCDGVREWLIGLGLSRYSPVFEIHEVDDEVLPMLTLEDLKDMGINAVGSRRKMYTAILKLRKGFS